MNYLYSNKHWQLNKEYNIDKLLYLMIDRPKYINKYNDFIWTNKKNQRHRDYDLPAYVYCYDNGICSLYWTKHGQYHRTNNPAIIYYNGDKKYFTNGIVYA